MSFRPRLKQMMTLGVMGAILSGCAAMTEPDVRAYLHEQSAYGEIQKGQLAPALQDLRLALRDNPKEPTILNNMAYIEFKEGHYKKAVGFLEQARVLRTDDNDEPYILNEARILIAHHEYHRALALLSLIEPRQKWPQGYRKIMAEALLHNGQSSRALAILLGQHGLTLDRPTP
ncbi:MAG: tetratricopeptide repeat protein [Leptospirales bacterium]